MAQSRSLRELKQSLGETGEQIGQVAPPARGIISPAGGAAGGIPLKVQIPAAGGLEQIGGKIAAGIRAVGEKIGPSEGEEFRRTIRKRGTLRGA